jgi:hypothetical protein
VADWDDVERIALALPEVTERTGHGSRQWRVRDKLFVWERPLRPKELLELGAEAPGGPVLAARVEHLIAKQALLEDDPEVYFTTSHFEGYAAILARLELIAKDDLAELITEGWLVRAPKRLASEYLRERG